MTTAWIDDVVAALGKAKAGALAAKAIIHDLGRAFGARAELDTADLERRAREFADEVGTSSGNPSLSINSLWVCCIALVARDRKKSAPVVTQLTTLVQGHLEATGRANWVPLTKQALEAILWDT